MEFLQLSCNQAYGLVRWYENNYTDLIERYTEVYGNAKNFPSHMFHINWVHNDGNNYAYAAGVFLTCSPCRAYSRRWLNNVEDYYLIPSTMDFNAFPVYEIDPDGIYGYNVLGGANAQWNRIQNVNSVLSKKAVPSEAKRLIYQNWQYTQINSLRTTGLAAVNYQLGWLMHIPLNQAAVGQTVNKQRHNGIVPYVMATNEITYLIVPNYSLQSGANSPLLVDSGNITLPDLSANYANDNRLADNMDFETFSKGKEEPTEKVIPEENDEVLND